MPHRATYFFPRQFPDNGGNNFQTQPPHIQPSSSLDHETTTTRKKKSDHDITSVKKLTNVYNNSNNTKKLAAFYNWLAKKECVSYEDEEHELLLQTEPEEVPIPVPVPPVAIPDRQASAVSLVRLSSCGSSYGGVSVYSSDIHECRTNEIEEEAVVRGGKEKEGGGAGGEDDDSGNDEKKSLAEKVKEGFYLQLNLAKRIGDNATLGNEPRLLMFDGGAGGGGSETNGLFSDDPITASCRLWVNGCLSYSDKISDGFYNIIGMNPHVWAMCNDFEDAKQIPSLMSLNAVSPHDTTMEVVLVDKNGDSKLRELQDRAQELCNSSKCIQVLVEQLGKLVSVHMGGDFLVEQGDLDMRWKMVSKRLKELHKCIVLPIGSLSSGLCRHRAILFKKLADYVGLPCRIAQGCRYCAEDHRSSCLVIIEDDRQSPRPS